MIHERDVWKAWQNDMRVEGVLAERARIIKLLRERISYAVLVEDDEDGIIQAYETEDLIALIRGED